VELAALLSLPTACIAFTVSETKVFAPLRDRAGGRSAWLGRLLSCGYCLGVWVSLGLVIVYRPLLFELWRPLDYLLTALVVSWLAAFQWAALCWLIDRTGR
jgi:hypothetical protein